MVIATGRSNWTIGYVCLLTAVWAWTSGCGNSSGPAGSNSSGGNSGSGGAGTGGGVAPSTLPCISADAGPSPHDYGNFDYRTCNGLNCHGEDNWSGGWVYTTAAGVPWVSGATVTITNSDGTTDTAVSGTTGFFYLEKTFTNTTTKYTACVSKCPTTYCNTTLHTNRDCLASGCHSSPTQRIFVVSGAGAGGSSGTGGSGPGTTDCSPPASGGPYVHSSATTGSTPCSYGGCHNDPAYEGGFVFDAVTSDKSVAEATITLKPTSGSQVTAVSGPDGMFFFGTRDSTTGLGTPTTFSAPYIPCVSKCPKTLCSPDTSNHTTTQDCSNCHDYTLRIYLQ